MIKFCSSTQISSVHYCQFRPPGLNSCLNLVNRKEPLIWMNSGMNLGGRIASPQGTHSYLVVPESPWCAQSEVSPLQCPPLPAQCSVCSGVRQGMQLGMGWGVLCSCSTSVSRSLCPLLPVCPGHGPLPKTI